MCVQKEKEKGVAQPVCDASLSPVAWQLEHQTKQYRGEIGPVASISQNHNMV